MTPIESLAAYSAKALTAYHARHVDDTLACAACFFWNAQIRRFEVSVLGHVVATFRTAREVEAFSAMHNGRVEGIA